MTLITIRSGESSYMKSRAPEWMLESWPCNTFIPSTLKGSCINVEAGMLDSKKTLMLPVTLIYSGLMEFHVVIQLYKGATDSEQVKRQNNLLMFLKRSNKTKPKQEQFAYFQGTFVPIT